MTGPLDLPGASPFSLPLRMARIGMANIYRQLCCFSAILATAVPAFAVDIYHENFNAPSGTKYPEWTSSTVIYESAAAPPGTGSLPPQVVTNCLSANGAQSFLGEFGGPKIGTAADPGYNRTAVEQTIRLTLANLPAHRALRLSFDLFVLKSWDGNSPQFGPDRLRLEVDGGPKLFDTSFSNNHKVERQGSYQDFPHQHSLPQTQAHNTNTLGYDFFGNAIYKFQFAFPHDQEKLKLEFTSDLFEGKGTDDESWGIDNVKIETIEGSSQSERPVIKDAN